MPAARLDRGSDTAGGGLQVAKSSRGLGLGDLDNDGDLDILVTNYEGETNELYRNEGYFRFTPMGASMGLAAVSRPLVGWGTGLVDLDHDGRNLEQGVGRGVESAGLDVDDHRQEAAEAVAHRGQRGAHAGASVRNVHSSVSPAQIGTTSDGPKG